MAVCVGVKQKYILIIKVNCCWVWCRRGYYEREKVYEVLKLESQHGGSIKTNLRTRDNDDRYTSDFGDLHCKFDNNDVKFDYDIDYF